MERECAPRRRLGEESCGQLPARKEARELDGVASLRQVEQK